MPRNAIAFSMIWTAIFFPLLAPNASARPAEPNRPWDALIDDSWIGQTEHIYMRPANANQAFEIRFKDTDVTGPKAGQARGLKAARFKYQNQTTGRLYSHAARDGFEVCNYGRDWIYYEFTLVVAVDADDLPDDFAFSFSAHEPNQWDAALGPGDFVYYHHPEYDTQRPSGHYSLTDPCSEPLASAFDTDGYAWGFDPNSPRHDYNDGMVAALFADNVILNPNGGAVAVYYQFENLTTPAAFSIYIHRSGYIEHTNRAVIDKNDPLEPVSTFEVIPLKPDFNGDGIVDLCDLYTLSAHWLQENDNPHWLPRADLHPDGLINLTDFACFARAWRAGRR